MPGLSRQPDRTRPRDTVALLVLDPIEGLTRALMRGDPFSEQSLKEMELLRNRHEAFGKALQVRIDAEDEKNEVIE
jgi:hypothetical protein